jgi:hypothetical protein
MTHYILQVHVHLACTYILSRDRVLNSGGPFKVAVSAVPADAHRSPQKMADFSRCFVSKYTPRHRQYISSYL